MPKPGRAEQIRLLRNSIARIEAGSASARMEAKREAETPQTLGQASEKTLTRTASDAGFQPPASDIRLAPPRPPRFYEIAPASAADCSAAAGFALSIAGQMVKSLHRPLLWVAEDFALMEQGAPYAPGLAAYGISISDFTLIRTRSRLDIWRVMEEAIKSRAFAAIIGEPATLAGRDLPSLIRRLTINARASQSCAILLRPPTPDGFIAPSPLRFEIAAASASADERKQLAAGGGKPALAATESAQSALAQSALARPLPSPPVWSVHYRGAPGSTARLQQKTFHPERPFRASPSRAHLPHAGRPAPLSRSALLEEVTSMMIEERSSAALPVDISYAA